MADEVVIRTGRKIAVGADFWELRDDGVPVHYVDMITEIRHHNTVIYVGLASAVIDANNEPYAVVAGRFRMDVGTAQNLHKFLGDAIAAALKPVSSSSAN